MLPKHEIFEFQKNKNYIWTPQCATFDTTLMRQDHINFLKNLKPMYQVIHL
jgi:hypothetical protein